jgi:hypothetical protein
MPPELLPAIVAALTALLTGLSQFLLGLLNEDPTNEKYVGWFDRITLPRN